MWPNRLEYDSGQFGGVKAVYNLGNTSVTLTRFLDTSWYFSVETSFGIFRLGSFAQEISRAISRLGSSKTLSRSVPK